MLSLKTINKRLFYHLSALCAIGFFSCSKKDQPTPASTTLLTYQNNSADTDNWIYVTDEDGTILDTKQFTTGQQVILKTSNKLPTQKINVTIFGYKKLSTGNETYTFNTYLAVAVNDSWLSGTDKPLIFPKSSVTKSSTLQITNFPYTPTLDCFVSTNNGSIMNSLGYGSNTVTVSFNPYDASKFYVAAYNNNQPVFKEFANPSNINSFSTNFTTDFSPTDHAVDIPTYASANNYLGSVSAFRKNENNITYGGPADLAYYDFGGYYQSYRFLSPSTFKLGYNDGFDYYITRVQTSFTSVYYEYHKLGQPPSTIPVINFSSTITNKSFSNFAFTISDNYDYRLSYWYFSTSTTPSQGTYWNVYSPMDGKQNLANIPAEITTKYPGIAVGSLKYDKAIFYHTYDGFKYDDFIGGKMRPNSGKKLYSREYYTVQVSN